VFYELIHLYVNNLLHSLSFVSEEVGVVVRREDGSFAVSEADVESVTLADSAKVDGITVKEELALFASRELDGLFSLPAELEHRSVLGLFSTRDGSGTEHISSGQVASGNGVMSDGLGDGVVEVLHVTLGHHVVVSHSGGLDVDLEVDVV